MRSTSPHPSRGLNRLKNIEQLTDKQEDEMTKTMRTDLLDVGLCADGWRPRTRLLRCETSCMTLISEHRSASIPSLRGRSCRTTSCVAISRCKARHRIKSPASRLRTPGGSCPREIECRTPTCGLQTRTSDLVLAIGIRT